MIYLLYIIWIIFCLFIIFLYLLEKKITKLEKKIINLFSNRSDTIPALYETTNNYLIKHNEIFKNILNLRNKEFTLIDNNSDYFDVLNTETLIHKEFNFILKISKENHNLLKNNKFLYIRDIIIEKSLNIWNNIEIYKNIIKKYNKFITIKNLSIIWLIIPIYKKEGL